MAKAPTETKSADAPKESPADRIKRELAEKAAAEKQKTLETLNSSDDSANTDDTDQSKVAKPEDDADPDDESKAFSGVSGSEVKEKPEEESPEVKAAREEKFRRAQEFEAKRAAAIAARNVPPTQTYAQPDEQDVNVVGADEGYVVVRMPKDAFDAIFAVAIAIPPTTPREHVMCGYTTNKITVGNLRDAAGLKRQY